MSSLVKFAAPTGTMSSLEIAELVEKRHDNVKRTIETLAASGVISLPYSEKTCFKGSDGRRQTATVFVFSGDKGRRDSLILVAQLCWGFTARALGHWQELELAAQPAPAPALAGFAGELELAHNTVLELGAAIKSACTTEITCRESYDAATEGVEQAMANARKARGTLAGNSSLVALIDAALDMAGPAYLSTLGVVHGKFTRAKELAPTCKTYIVRNNLTRLVKIGRSIDPVKRICALGVGSGVKLEVLAIIEGDIEQVLHKKFAALRVFREWFEDDGSIATYATNLTA